MYVQSTYVLRWLNLLMTGSWRSNPALRGGKPARGKELCEFDEVKTRRSRGIRCEFVRRQIAGGVLVMGTEVSRTNANGGALMPDEVAGLPRPTLHRSRGLQASTHSVRWFEWRAI